jgi:NlpC/P60 family.
MLLTLLMATGLQVHGMAVIKKPIIEMNSDFPPPQNPSASPDTGKCNRAHQGLYNELVDCIEEKDDFVKITMPHIKYRIDAPSSFWIYKNGIIPLKELAHSDIAHSIPHPDYAQEPTIVLTQPWHNFSVGTRFRHIPEHDTESTYAIIRADFTENKAIFDEVLRENALCEMQQDRASTRKLFVKIVNNLIDHVAQNSPQHVIPYVWGGSSFVIPYTESEFYKKDGGWHREGKNDPYSGYDCSEFVMRMAQIAGIDFPWKTSMAIKNAQKELTDQDQLEEGDIIWRPGHVIIISNIERNEIIEARGYGNGYGCVHRAPLCEIFQDIHTYPELLAAHSAQSQLVFLDKQKIPGKAPVIFKILKLN